MRHARTPEYFLRFSLHVDEIHALQAIHFRSKDIEQLTQSQWSKNE